jgi:hypothetical protein
MRISRASLVTFVAILAVAAILGSACAAPAPPPVTPPAPAQAPSHPPVISKVTANPAQVVSGDSTTIIAVAASPDDNPLTYSWSASEGTITGTGRQVTWVSPNKSGNFNIGVTVNDNLGGQTTGSVTVSVLAPTNTVTLNPVPSETGTVNQTNATDYSRTMAGDNAQGNGLRAFWSFDISSLEDKDIQNASLKFTTGNLINDPFSEAPAAGLGLGGLWLWQDTYGNSLPEYSYVGSQLRDIGLMYQPPANVDVSTELKLLTSHGVNRFQVEALFTRSSNGDYIANYIEWSSVVLEVTYSVK